MDDPSIFPTGPTNCGMPAAQNMCSQIFAQSIQASGNINQNWQPGLPLTIEGRTESAARRDKTETKMLRYIAGFQRFSMKCQLTESPRCFV